VPFALVGHKETSKLELFVTKLAVGIGRGRCTSFFWLNWLNVMNPFHMDVQRFHPFKLFIALYALLWLHPLLHAVLSPCVEGQCVFSHKSLLTNIAGKIVLYNRCLRTKELHFFAVPFLLMANKDAGILELVSA